MQELLFFRLHFYYYFVFGAWESHILRLYNISNKLHLITSTPCNHCCVAKSLHASRVSGSTHVRLVLAKKHSYF